MLLLLAGTREAQEISAALSKSNIHVIASLAGVTRDPADMPLPTRRGGFGGAAGFHTFLKEYNIQAILDATHPFATQISQRTARIAKEMDLPYRQLLRPPWHPEEGDHWIAITSEDQATAHIKDGSTVFLATGRQTLDRFSNLESCRLICRQIDPPGAEFPFPNGEYLVGRPPFSVDDEVALFKRLGVDFLIVKNAGGQSSKSKLTAARELNIPVIMLERADTGRYEVFENVQDSLQWVQGLAWSDD